MSQHSDQTVQKASNLIKFYLVIYNLIQTFGWSILLLRLFNYYISPDEESTSLYQHIKWPLSIFQTAAVLEIIHAVTGIVPSNPIFTSIQVFLRVSFVHGIIANAVTAQKCIGFPTAMLSWAITEVVRYSYYTLNLANVAPYFLMWLRYSTYIVLYPIGTFSEFLCVYTAQNTLLEKVSWNINLPFSVNFTFYAQYLALFLMIATIPVFLRLYKHMSAQRRKILGGTDGSNVRKYKKMHLRKGL